MEFITRAWDSLFTNVIQINGIETTKKDTVSIHPISNFCCSKFFAWALNHQLGNNWNMQLQLSIPSALHFCSFSLFPHTLPDIFVSMLCLVCIMNIWPNGSISDGRWSLGPYKPRTRIPYFQCEAQVIPSNWILTHCF